MKKQEINGKYRAYMKLYGEKPRYALATVRFKDSGALQQRTVKLSLDPEAGSAAGDYLYVDGIGGLLKHADPGGDYQVTEVDFETPAEQVRDEEIAVAFVNKKNNRIVAKRILKQELRNRTVEEYARFALNGGEPTGSIIVCRPDSLKLDIAL